MIRPPLPRAGDRIRVVAPSGAFDATEFAHGIAWLRELDLEVIIPPDIYDRAEYLAGSDARRGRELAAAIADPEAAGVWCARGGYGAARLLPALAPEDLRAHPKWLFGFSDATALHAHWRRAGIASLHAANVTTLGKWQDGGCDRLRQWLTTGVMAALEGVTIHGGNAVQGVVAGGNLRVLASLAGTGYLPSFRDALVFLEDVNEPLYRLDRSLTQLLQAGTFEGARGFLIGQLTHCENAGSEAPTDPALKVLCELLEPFDVPLLAGLPVGHAMNALPLPFGLPAVLDPTAGELRVEGLTECAPRG